MALLILIRGNSGAGKTTLAQKLQTALGTKQCLLLSQDVLRRDLLHATDQSGSPVVDLIAELLKFGSYHFPLTILEGILRKDVYGTMLKQAGGYFDQGVLSYYLDLSFEKTVTNNQLRTHPFDRQLLEKWWRPKDYLSKDDLLLRDNTGQNFYNQIMTEISSTLAKK